MKYPFVFALTFLTFWVSAQNKKNIKLNHIKIITETTIVSEEGKDISWKSMVTVYGKNAKIAENTVFNRDGSIQIKETTKYDSKDNVIEETLYEVKPAKEAPASIGKGTKISGQDKIKNKKYTYKYDSSDYLIEETEFDADGKQIKRMQYVNTEKGDIATETDYDSSDKMKRKIVTAYGMKGMKSETKIYNADGKVVELVKYQYETF